MRPCGWAWRRFRAGLRLPTKKIAAVGALVAAAGYLALSGGNVATERAFVMVAVMLLAVLADRRALSLRAVALAACIILVLRPEALMGPGFQMSFAATTALVAVFGALRDLDWRVGPKWMRPVWAVVMSSFVAGLATAPIAAAHFNQIAHYGLVANLLSVPLMGALVMPMAVLAGLLMPLGLEGLALAVMQPALEWIWAWRIGSRVWRARAAPWCARARGCCRCCHWACSSSCCGRGARGLRAWCRWRWLSCCGRRPSGPISLFPTMAAWWG